VEKSVKAAKGGKPPATQSAVRVAAKPGADAPRQARSRGAAGAAAVVSEAVAPVTESAGQGALDLATIRALAQLIQDSDLFEVELRRGGDRVCLRRGPAATGLAHAPPTAWSFAAPPAAVPSNTPAPTPAAGPMSTSANGVAADEGSYSYITSPFVGTFYRSPGPEAPPFVEVGQRVRKGQPLCIIEAMKLMNEIEAEVDGTILAVLVENGKPVEYGEPLFKIAT
jgi:acetyl-CoA carboxylase biotin carboxyl carrier protein